MLADAKGMGTLDSAGTFTIAGEAAIGKLASFQLPRKSAWVLKIVQAAVTAESRSITVAQSNETTTFTFDTTVEFEVAQLKEALLSPQIVGPAPCRHLAVGLRAVGFGDRRAFTLAFDKDGKRTFLGWNGEQLTQREELLEEDSNLVIRLGVAFPEHDRGRSLGGLTKSAGRATDEYQELVRNCEACPVPLIVDGRRVDTLSASHYDQISGNTALISVGWSPHDARFPGPALELPHGLLRTPSKWKLTDKFTDDRVFFVDGDKTALSAGCLAKIWYSYKVVSHRSKHKSFQFTTIPRRSFYNWIKDGVVCQRQGSSDDLGAISFELYLSADDLETDISGLKLRHQTDTRLAQRKAKAREQLRFQAENAVEALSNHMPKPFTLHTAIYGTATAAFTLLGPFTAGKTWIGAIFAVNLAISAYDKRKIMKDCEGRLVRFCERLKYPERKH